MMMRNNIMDTLVAYEITDSGDAVKLYENITQLEGDLDSFIYRISADNPGKYVHYCTFSKTQPSVFGVASIDSPIG